MQVPAGITAVSVQQQEFAPDRFGIITVPDNLGEYLIGLGVGFAAVSERPPPAAERAVDGVTGGVTAGGSATGAGTGTLASVGTPAAAHLKTGAAVGSARVADAAASAGGNARQEDAAGSRRETDAGRSRERK